MIIYRFVYQYSAPCYFQKQPPCAVLQKSLSYKFCKIHKKTPKKRFRHRFFPANSAKFLITSFLKNPSESCFCINTPSVYCRPTNFRLFKKKTSYIFSGWVFPRLNLIVRQLTSIFWPDGDRSDKSVTFFPSYLHPKYLQFLLGPTCTGGKMQFLRFLTPRIG